MENGEKLWPWSWVEIECDEAMCLEFEHMTVRHPTRLRYPNGVCIYCGRGAGTRDHLVPRGISGETHRASVLTVPACAECNSTIGSAAVYSITGRRRIAHQGIRRRNRKKLRYQKLTEAELAEYGPGLRPALAMAGAEREQVEAMLAWPVDPEFDSRYLERSGIQDPYLLGLLD